MIESDLTPTEQRILSLLGDQRDHSKKELLAAIGDFTDCNTLRVHISRLRKKISNGYDLFCSRTDNGCVYRLVRNLASANDGRA